MYEEGRDAYACRWVDVAIGADRAPVMPNTIQRSCVALNLSEASDNTDQHVSDVNIAADGALTMETT